jgi:hypothetical protein
MFCCLTVSCYVNRLPSLGETESHFLTEVTISLPYCEEKLRTFKFMINIVIYIYIYIYIYFIIVFISDTLFCITIISSSKLSLKILFIYTNLSKINVCVFEMKTGKLFLLNQHYQLQIIGHFIQLINRNEIFHIEGKIGSL